MDRRVVITGVGAVSPTGLDAQSSFDACLRGQSGIARITRFDPERFTSKIAGEVKNFDPEKWIERKKIKEVDRFIQFALAASTMAMEQSGFAPNEEQKERVGTFIGVGFCGLENVEIWAKTLFERGPNKISPYFIPSTISNLAPGQVSLKYGFKGPSYTHTSACSSGGHAIGDAFHWIRRGGIDAAIAGGAEASVTGLGVGGFTALRALSVRNDDPTAASRPWDRDRDGFVIAEGAGVVVMEEREHAMKRGAPILAEVVGYGASSDAYHITHPAPEGEGAQRAMKIALADARLNATQVDYINAHGTSTPLGDVQEIAAVRHVFGSHARDHLWVSSTKSLTGHLLGAAGGLEAVFSVLTLASGLVPGTANLHSIDPDCGGVDLMPLASRERRVQVALSNSFGFGGTNVTLAFARHS